MDDWKKLERWRVGAKRLTNNSSDEREKKRNQGEQIVHQM